MERKRSKSSRWWGVVLVLALAQETRSQEDRLVVWQQQDPWGRYTPDLRPPARGGEKISSQACINEYASLMLLVAAPQHRDKTAFRVDVEDLRNGEHLLPRGQVRIRELALARQAWDGRVVADPLLEHETFAISPQQTKALWLTIHTRDAVAGEYQGTLRLTDQQGSQQSVRLTVTVWPVALPGELPIAFHAFEDDSPAFQSCLEAHVRDLAEHYVNTFGLRSCAFPQLDSRGKVTRPIREPEYVDRKLRLMAKCVRKPRVLSAFVASSTIAQSADWEETYRAWVNAMLACLGRAGLGYDDFFVGYLDEFHGADAQAYHKAGPALRRIAPRVRLYGGLGDATLIDEARRVAPYVDLWDLPHPDLPLPKAREKMEYLKGTGKPIWYDGPYLNGAALDQPYPMLLLVPWMVWKYDLQGADFFTYNRQADFDFQGDTPVTVPALRGDADQAAVIYPTAAGPVGSRRWEAFREGWTHYLCLDLLRKELQQAQQAGVSGPSVSEAQALIQESVDKVLASPGETTLAGRYKERLVRAILRLRQR